MGWQVSVSSLPGFDAYLWGYYDIFHTRINDIVLAVPCQHFYLRESDGSCAGQQTYAQQEHLTKPVRRRQPSRAPGS